MLFIIDSIREDRPGIKWQEKFKQFWPSYRKWFLSEGACARPGYLTSAGALHRHMPELIPVYETLIELSGGGDLAARFLSLFCPPPYMTGCSHAVWQASPSKLIRNYDYHPKLFEGTLFLTKWCQPVIAMTDSLWGVLDGVNKAGLAVSLAFGGRKIVGRGFGIPLVLRYVLEVCASTKQAVEVLKRLPVHMTYNVLVLDAKGKYASVYLNPDRDVVVADACVGTNHQESVEWPDYARFSKTVERKEFLEDRLADSTEKEHKFIKRFLHQPIYQTTFGKGFGTLYTAVYNPAYGSLKLFWPHRKLLTQSFKKFVEHRTIVKLRPRVNPGKWPLG